MSSLGGPTFKKKYKNTMFLFYFSILVFSILVIIRVVHLMEHFSMSAELLIFFLFSDLLPCLNNLKEYCNNVI